MMQVKPVFLADFIADVEDELENLQYQALNWSENSLRLVSHSVHTIKGNASLLGIKSFSEKAHEVEDQVQTEANNLEQLQGLLQNYLGGLVSSINALKENMGRIEKFQNDLSNDEPAQVLFNGLSELAQRVANREKKKIIFKGKIEIPSWFWPRVPVLRKVLVQLVRNSVTHGIESPETRTEKRKGPVGSITITTSVSSNELVVTLEDDGAGIDTTRVKERAIMQGILKESPEPGRAEIIQSLFHPGFSTREIADENAGRGIGLDLVKNLLKRNHATMKLAYAENRFTRFQLVFKA